MIRLDGKYDIETLIKLGAITVWQYPPTEENGDWITEYEGEVDITKYQEMRLKLVKEKKINEIKIETSKRIDAVLPDWKVRRHEEQVKLGVTTSIAPDDFLELQKKCQAIRDASNAIEMDMHLITSPEEIEAIDITSHALWP